MRWETRFAALALLAAAFNPPASAHRLGEGYIYLNCDPDRLRGRVELMLSDLTAALPLDANGDSKISDEELETGYPALEAYVRERVAVGANGADFPLRFVSHNMLDVTLGRFVQMHFVAEGVREVPDEIEAEYRILFDANPNHRGFLVTESNYKIGLTDNEAMPSLIFTPEEPRAAVDLTQEVTSAGFVSFVGHGIWHIWIGIDHILFVISLVMAAVLLKPKDSNENRSFGSTLLEVAKVITLFTIAHSITLSLAALGWVNLTPRIVESIIAISVAAAALNNIYPLFRDWTWTIVFAFGLFHGFGFASVLGHLTQARMALVTSLLGFNVGVEIGQLAVIVAAFPILYFLRSRPALSRPVLVGGSALIAVIAAIWFVERAFELG